MRLTTFLLLTLFSLSLISSSCGSTNCEEQNNSAQYFFQGISNPEPFTITIVFDNYRTDTCFTTAWGFSCYIQYGETNILFDTGVDGEILLHNMQALNINPADIDLIVISHEHSDHINGLPALLGEGVNVPVYLLNSFSQNFKNDVSSHTEIVEVSETQEIIPGVYTTGDMGTSIHEQSLVVETNEGLIVLTGCAHPGISNIVDKALEMIEGNIYLVLGGFHLVNFSETDVQPVIDHFHELNIENVCATHCTGESAISAFRSGYGENYVGGGVGMQINIP